MNNASTKTYKLETIAEWPLYSKLEAFAKNVSLGMEKYWKDQKFTHSIAPRCMLESVGKRYAKLGHFEWREVALSAPQYKCTSVYCFVDLTNGDLLKGTWKAPVANGVRGNLADADLLEKFTVYGPSYTRGGNSLASLAYFIKL